MISKRAILAVVVAALSIPALVIFRHYPWQFAVPVGFAFGLLAYLAAGTFERMRASTRRTMRNDRR